MAESTGPAGIDLVSGFVLLALHPRHGVRQLRRAQLDAGLAGAALAELSVRGRIERAADGTVAVRDPEPTGVAIADEALAAIASGPPRKPGYWVAYVRSPRLWDRVRGEMSAAGLLTPRRVRVAGLVPVRRYPATDTAVRERLAAEVDAVLGGTGAPSGRAGELAALVVAAGLTARVVGTVKPLRARDVLRASWAATAAHNAASRADADVVTTTVGGVA